MSAALGERVRAFARGLVVDRCFVYLRDPAVRAGRVVVGWRRAVDVADVPDAYFEAWAPEPADGYADDPMFVAALAGHAATYVDDIENAGGLVNPEVERRYRHRALVHINLFADGSLWGILQPAMSTVPRSWDGADKARVEAARADMTPLAMAIVRAGPWTGPVIRLIG